MVGAQREGSENRYRRGAKAGTRGRGTQGINVRPLQPEQRSR
jgi:hypothetical protein